MTAGQRIKAARKAAGMTQKDLAGKLGIAYQTLAQWENDLRNPKYETLERLADALDVPVEVLLGIGDSISPVGTVGAGGHVQPPTEQYVGSIRVHVSPEQREYGELMKKYADGTIIDAEMRRLGELRANQPPLDESLERLTGTLERMKEYLAPLNDVGQLKVIRHAEDYAKDLAKVPEYRAKTVPQSPVATSCDEDPTPPPDGAEGPQEGE